MRILAVVVFHLPHAKLVGILPDHLAQVARALLGRKTLRYRAGHFPAGLIAQVAVREPLHLRYSKILVGKLAAHEGTGAVRRTDALDPCDGRQIEPLIVRRVLVRVDQKRRARHIARHIENEQAAVAVALDLEHLDAKFPQAFLALPVAQHHRLTRREVAETPAALPRLDGDREPPLLGTRALGLSQRRGQDERANAEPQREDPRYALVPMNHVIPRYWRSILMSGRGETNRAGAA